MLQTKTARWTAGTALVCVTLLAAAWFLLVAPRHAEAVDLRTSTVAALARNDTLELKTAELRAQFVDLATDRAEVQRLLTQLPVGAGTPELLRSVNLAASTSGVTLKSLTPGAATYLTATGTTAGTATGTTTGTATGTASGAKIVSMPLSIAVSGDYFQAVVFLKKIQADGQRAFLVTSLQLTKAGDASMATAGNVDLTITGKVFSLPGSATTTPTAGTEQ